MDLLDPKETPKHLPPRKDTWKQDTVEDAAAEDEDLDMPKQYKTPKPDGDTPPRWDLASKRGVIAGKLDIFDVNDFTEADLREIVTSADEIVDPVTMKIDPYLALRIALDYVLWYGPDGLGEGSYYNLIGHNLYDELLASLADKHNLDVEVEIEPFKLRDDHLYQGLDLIEDARERVASVLDQLIMKRDQFQNRIRNMDQYLNRVQQGKEKTELVKVQMQESLEQINSQLEMEIKKLTNYQEFLKEALSKSIDEIFQNELGESPMVKIQFSKLDPDEHEDTWVLAFTAVINEVFDPKLDRRFDLSEDGMVQVADADSVLEEAGRRVKKKLNIIQHSFERFLRADVQVDSDNRIKGQVEENQYRAFAEFTFTVSVPVKDDADVKLITLSLADAIKDLMDANYGRLANRTASSPLQWYPDYVEEEDGTEEETE